eukprot:CAMPEP_0202869204 /NCGR_PEP_ID=MMETSP1391-20130828/12142_1 /ASSEMBLY_ACC=CAM_ASM_000867 /TAXON_ID=1034604 /ORGANISM="Chlamydomonas leiostraca, Strain SAG 11-49" /LENGTH=99 /DNA_ID=CAMNT_0049549487 /DNA_START=80 /DNA_END=379 /DNA_ORIENTATION=+
MFIRDRLSPPMPLDPSTTMLAPPACEYSKMDAPTPLAPPCGGSAAILSRAEGTPHCCARCWQLSSSCLVSSSTSCSSCFHCSTACLLGPGTSVSGASGV